ncbi:hypothetical protein KQI88_10285 [Alkaliphilus sp. MSJ-5]|uniref:DUF4013 domain-containing protein n=1 Tax=Alkaliphilus flagellatus TaxID=2841507 RepID=A0ABS6G2U1_9FIRM|nr:hypothetical protein [Alkaliphilus flagellatus]MBU5676806.1 hypothetical protein [Alkaliphilus flagellatus]
MENILRSISSSDSFIIDLTGIVTAIFPISVLLTIIIRYIKNIERTLIYKTFKFPSNIQEYRDIRNILKVLTYIIIQISLFGFITYTIVYYYLIYYGIFLPRMYGIKTFL